MTVDPEVEVYVPTARNALVQSVNPSPPASSLAQQRMI